MVEKTKNIFIGKKYALCKRRFLFIGESHYIENKGLKSDYIRIVEFLGIKNKNLKEQEIAFSNLWYNENYKFKQMQLQNNNYFSTDYVVKEVISNYEKGCSTSRPHKIIWIPAMIYNQVKGKEYDKKEIAKTLEEFCFMNYFTRPSLIQGESIKNDPYDNQNAFENLIYIIRQIQPDSIVFLSKKAYISFIESCALNKQYIEIEILNLRHPAYFKTWSKTGEDYLKLKEHLQKSIIV